MGIRKILVLGGPREKVLRTKAKKISRFDNYLERLVEDMWETMREAPGVGLAAPQIGESVRVLVAEYEDEHVALINPEILHAEGEELGTEGCLSIPGYLGDNVPRATAILIKARNPKGKEIKVRAEGWFARILQHEIDHLDGILYTDRISPRDVREVTEEDIAEEGAPQDSPTAKAKTPARPPSAGPAASPAPSPLRGERAGERGPANTANTATPSTDRDDASPAPNPTVSSASSVVSSAAPPAKTAAPGLLSPHGGEAGRGVDVQGGRQ